MEVIYVLIPISAVLVGIAAFALIRAIDGGQYDDLDSPPLDILGDDDQEGG